MRKIIVEAYEDASRPQGGHAVILLHGLEAMPTRPTFRLRPVDAATHSDPRGLWRAGSLSPLTTRQTDRGVEFVVGPDVVGHPMLLSGTPVVIEVPEAGVRGEFLWPSVAPLAQPRRRHLVVPRRPRRVDGDAIVVPPELPVAVPAVVERAYKNGNGNGAAGAHATTYAGTSNGFHAEFSTKAEPRADAVVIPLVIPEAPAAEVPIVIDTKSAITVPEAAGILDVQPVLIDVAEPLVELGSGATTTQPAATIASEWDAPKPAGKGADTLQWTPGREPRGTAGRQILHGAAGAAVLLAIAIFMMSGRKSGSPTPTAVSPQAPPPAVAAATPGGASGTPSAPPPAPENRDRTGPPAAAAVTAAPVAVKPACPAEPEIATQALVGGRMKLSVKAACRGGQEIKLGYGGAQLRFKLDADGKLDYVLDCFAGAQEPLDLQFADGKAKSIPVTALDLDRVTKIAVVWQAPVNLDLHAFEYAALPGGKGHVSAKAPGSLAVAQDMLADHRGHGFLSTLDDGRGSGDKVEVYTFLHNDEQTSGTVTLALDYETRGETPGEASCGKAPLAEIPYRVSVLKRGGQLTRENGLIAAAECGARISPEARFGQSVLPVLRIKK